MMKIKNRLIRKLERYDALKLIEKARIKKIQNTKLDTNQLLNNSIPVVMEWPPDIIKPRVGLVKSEIIVNSYWPKFEKFLRNNNIEYNYIDIKDSDFISKVESLDVIVWRTPSPYSDQWEAKDKVEFIQNHMNKLIMPNKESLWFYEDKVRQSWLFDYHNIPSIKTFISYNFEEINEYIKRVEFPIISKDKTSSSAYGVRELKNKSDAKKLVNEIFNNGLKLYEPYIKQKNYVIFQEKVPNEGYDLRVIIIGNSYFGYYRYPKKGDFKASGSGIVEKKDIPLEVLKLSKQIKEKLPKSYMLAVDYLEDSRDGKFYVIETSIFISVETSEQLIVNKVPGRYVYSKGEFIFEKGNYWVQELMMVELMNDWISIKKGEKL